MNNKFLTLRHKDGTILATIEEKCVTLSNLQGEIYKQFPRQFFRSEDWAEEVSFPGNYREAREKFNKKVQKKKADALAIAEASYIRWREERRQEVRFVRRVRNMAFRYGEYVSVYRTRAFDMELSSYDGQWYRNSSTLEDEENKVFLQKEDAETYYEELKVKYAPSSGSDSPVEIAIEEVRVDSSDILDITDYESMLALLKDDCAYDDVKLEILFPNYKSIEGAIYVEWAWTPYIGYARCFGGLHVGLYSETEEDLITGNEERTERTNRTLLLSAEDIADLSAEQLTEALEEELHHRNDWRWRCSDAKIDNAIAKIVEELKPEIS